MWLGPAIGMERRPEGRPMFSMKVARSACGFRFIPRLGDPIQKTGDLRISQVRPHGADELERGIVGRLPADDRSGFGAKG